MGISFNPSALIIKWLTDSKDAQLRRADFLDELVEESEFIVNIWQEVTEKIINNSVVNDNSIEALNEVTRPYLGVPSLDHANIGPVSRLLRYYLSISSVFGEGDTEHIDTIIYHVGSILTKRDLTKDNVSNCLSDIKEACFFASDNHIDNFKSLEKSVVSLHKEVAALRVFAKTFRAKIK